jgi:hypothetical protein
MRSQSNDSLERFIRGELGCQCPAAVFRDIAMEPCPRLFGEWPGGWLVSVGNRLLVLVLPCDDRVAMQRRLGSLCEAGRRLRDARGFNRFRLVVATSRPEDMALSLVPLFDDLEAGDERLHLHVVAAGRLPDLPAGHAVGG